MLDLFSGLGGASRPMRDRGWRVITVDSESRFRPDIEADIGRWRCPFEEVDLIWASPPCTEFARESMPWCRTGNAPDFSLIEATLRIVREVKPRWWILENVRGLQWWLGRSVARFGPVYLWGWFPHFEAPERWWKERLPSTRDDLRAQVPYEIGEALAVAIEEAAGESECSLFRGMEAAT
jgi:site-specific DNA-cytosine methylase